MQENLESNVALLQHDISALNGEVKELWRKIPRLLLIVEGEDGKGGMRADVTLLRNDVIRLIDKQETILDRQMWAMIFPTLISCVSLLLSVIAITK